MSYCTRHDLKVVISTTATRDADIIEQLWRGDNDAALFITQSGSTNEEGSWHYYKTMKDFSKKFPGVVFQLTGYGEEPGDVWRTYFSNGKSQAAKTEIIFEPFDASKLT